MGQGKEIIERLYEVFLASAGVQTDSRKVQEGEIFFALRGDNFDGNRYASSALDKGAVVTVVDDPSVAIDERYVVVPDVLTALQELALRHRQSLTIPVLAITGTNGKTTTKELTAAVLSEKYKTCYTQGNLNNHIGVPLTLLSIPSDAEFAIIEMGASAQGEIALLASIASPDYGLITNIGRAHLEGFGGVEGIRKGKGELYDFLQKKGGTVLYRKEDGVLGEMVSERKGLKSVGYTTALADGVVSNLVGDYNRFNIAAALAVGEYFGVPKELALRGVAEYVPSNNRSQSQKTERNLLTVDCYNANPSSMGVAIANHAGAHHDDYPQKVMILGDMLELGEWSAEEHERILREALASDAERILLVGRNFMQTSDGGERVERFASAEELGMWLEKENLEKAFVLVKGSRGVGLERCIKWL
ncbi:MAG: UDP-N-acetylmuramoyl-tripeptide--D-alanyl-D-alanine ligase [Tidjanibacter sp.]|nr:UDP-N-acetylmuramoyl-tripeptide--D-alanyl-D-alanine ligase [Tidjanibacter sp.]